MLRKSIYQYDMEGNYLDSFLSLSSAAKRYSVDKACISRACDKHNKSAKGFKWSFSKKDNLNDDVSLQEICKKTGVPLENINYYWLKGKKYSLNIDNPDKLNADKQFQILLNELGQDKKPFEINSFKSSLLDTCTVINIYDIHLDKRDVNNPENAMVQLEKLIDEIKSGFTSIANGFLAHSNKLFILPVGNDLFCTNGFSNTTKKGTPQDPILPHDIVFKKGLELIRELIDTLLNFGNVYVPIIYGNHSVDSEYFLGMCLEILYAGNNDVIIQNEKKQRKYYRYGANLFGFAHGDKEKKNVDKLPLIMATDNAKDWGNTKYRTFFLGDIHHNQEFKFLRAKDNAGCTVEFLRSVGVTDSWHEDNGYVGIPRTIEATVFSNNKGKVANYAVNV